jgi:hypothetical protein
MIQKYKSNEVFLKIGSTDITYRQLSKYTLIAFILGVFIGIGIGIKTL